jgi:hypothetical protein
MIDWEALRELGIEEDTNIIEAFSILARRLLDLAAGEKQDE